MRGTPGGGRTALAVVAIVALTALAPAAALAESAGDTRAAAAGGPAAEAGRDAAQLAPGAGDRTAAEGEAGAPALPFTGVDAAVLIAIALSLLAAGFTLRRLSSREP